jgi:S1-C subfamily serine protease
VFYYSGHGASDDQGHYLAMAKGKLHRNKVLDAMLRKGPRLAVLITDCCNLRSDGEMFFAPYFQVNRPSSPTPLFRSLFLEPKGIVDVNSSSPGEGAFFAPSGDDIGSKRGSIFTRGLAAWVEKNQSQRRVWDDLVRGVSLQVHASFHDYYPKGIQASKGDKVQTQQNVFPFQYPGMPENKGPRTGFLIRDFPGKGAVITTVAANTPASQVFLVDKEVFASLKPQQVIISINGKPVENTDQVVKAIAQSPQIARLRVREAVKGEFDVLIRMRY